MDVWRRGIRCRRGRHLLPCRTRDLAQAGMATNRQADRRNLARFSFLIIPGCGLFRSNVPDRRLGPTTPGCWWEAVIDRKAWPRVAGSKTQDVAVSFRRPLGG
jgi:hypothetical protein